jgi:hypothetical protein
VTQAQVQRERKSLLREIRRRQRRADTNIERLERRIFALLDRKTLIEPSDALSLYNHYFGQFWFAAKEMEKALAAFVTYMGAEDQVRLPSYVHKH